MPEIEEVESAVILGNFARKFFGGNDAVIGRLEHFLVAMRRRRRRKRRGRSQSDVIPAEYWRHPT